MQVKEQFAIAEIRNKRMEQLRHNSSITYEGFLESNMEDIIDILKKHGFSIKEAKVRYEKLLEEAKEDIGKE